MGLKVMENAVQDPDQHLKINHLDWEIFQYSYQFTMKDKIYVSSLRDKGLKQLCLNSYSSQNMNYDLAGEIHNEYRITEVEAVERVNVELSYHLSNILGEKVSRLNLISSNNNKVSLWINFQKPTEFNPCHSHSGIFSFVFYASIPESIRQEHKAATGNMQTKGIIEFSSQFTNDKLYFNPTADTLFVFESSHVHQVYPYYSDETRISIAGNVHGWS